MHSPQHHPLQQTNLGRLQAELSVWQPDRVGTLVYLLRNRATDVLLIKKRSGHGQGLINGPGGKLEPTETIYHCAQRELLEEVGVSASAISLQARIRFVELDGPQWLGFVFIAKEFTGNPSSSPEAIPSWYPTQQLPWSQMWPADAEWLPQVLRGERLEVNLLFDAGELLAKQVLTQPAG